MKIVTLNFVQLKRLINELVMTITLVMTETMYGSVHFLVNFRLNEASRINIAVDYVRNGIHLNKEECPVVIYSSRD